MVVSMVAVLVVMNDDSRMMDIGELVNNGD